MTTARPKAHKDRGMEGMVAKWYAANTGVKLDEFVKLARRVASEVPPGSKVLEVAPGPGYFAIELGKLKRYSITALDISHTFVEIARKNAVEAHVEVDFRQGNAASMPFEQNTFDFLLCRAAFKNFGAPVRALQEMCRVLKPGGRGWIIDLRKDASPESIRQAVDAMGLNPVNRLLTRMVFRTVLIRAAYTREQFEAMLGQAGFRSVEIQALDMGFEISMVK